MLKATLIWRVCRHAGADTLTSWPSRHLRDGATPAIRRENKKRQISELIPPAKRMLRSKTTTDNTKVPTTKGFLNTLLQRNITLVAGRPLETLKKASLCLFQKETRFV